MSAREKDRSLLSRVHANLQPCQVPSELLSMEIGLRGSLPDYETIENFYIKLSGL